jgi:uncharacterized membrane protein YkvA (DUF1232 family)
VFVERLLWILALSAALLATSWLVMVLLARRLPPGLLRDVAVFLPACVTAARRLRGRPEVPRRAKLALLVAVLWVLSPIDLIPEFLPVIGPLDDVVAVVLLLRYAARSIPARCCSRPGPRIHGCSFGCSTAAAPLEATPPLFNDRKEA